jgi:predicted PurR-regulated permease PerM
VGALIAEWIQRNRRLISGLVGFVLAAAILSRIRGAITPFALAIVLAYVFNPIVKALVGRGLPRPAALLSIYLGFLILVGIGIGLLVPWVVVELTRLAEFLPEYFAKLQELAYRLQEQYSQAQLPLTVRQAIDDALLTLQANLLGMVSRAVTGVLGVFSAFINLAAAVVLSYYLIRDTASLRAGLSRFIRSGERQRTMTILSEVDRVVAGFVRGQLTVALIVGSLITIALLVLDVRFAVTLGIVAGVAEVIPYFGPVIGAIPALAVTVAISPLLALKVLAVFLVVQQLEAHLISPRIMGHSVGLHPVAVIFALLAGYELFGIVGMVAAVPAAGVIRVLLEHWLADRDDGVAQAATAAVAPEQPPGAGQAPAPQVE